MREIFWHLVVVAEYAKFYRNTRCYFDVIIMDSWNCYSCFRSLKIMIRISSAEKGLQKACSCVKSNSSSAPINKSMRWYLRRDYRWCWFYLDRWVLGEGREYSKLFEWPLRIRVGFSGINRRRFVGLCTRNCVQSVLRPEWVWYSICPEACRKKLRLGCNCYKKLLRKNCFSRFHCSR